MRIGIVGTGFIAQAMVEGLLRNYPDGPHFVLSPRNADTASQLTRKFPLRIRVATSNQQVVDTSDFVILSVRPASANSIISELRFRPEQTIVSVVASIPLLEVRRSVSPATKVVLAIPLPSMARTQAPFAIFPEDAVVRELFSPTGSVVSVDNEKAYAALGTATAVMAPYFHLASILARWLSENGVAEDMATRFVSGLLSGLSSTAALATTKNFDALAAEHATPGSFNEQLMQHLAQKEFEPAVKDALAPLLARMSSNQS
ncbi:NAD(P)-binding domain-containing protein [Paraburkholderia oxyphila]|uniref:NAD(P)-binding domain-containing protein n=1 Tax=Paraburkholderia oxyphila TaxID=614212 RepID=UPI0006945B41|nr:NAD(P)-binding domain-containing protein [Paraburkholderia oxyphila]